MRDLRDRIAAAIEAQKVSEYQGGVHPEDVMRLADAVIAALGLRPEWGSLDDDFGGILYDDRAEVTTGHGEKVYSRYITEWRPDDE